MCRPAWIDEKVKTIPASINQVCAPFIKADLRLADSLHQCEEEGGNANCLNKTFVGCGQTKNCRWGRKGSQTGHLYNNKAGIPSSQCNCTDGNYKSLMSMSKHSNRQSEIGRFLDIANQVLLFADFMSFLLVPEDKNLLVYDSKTSDSKTSHSKTNAYPCCSHQPIMRKGLRCIDNHVDENYDINHICHNKTSSHLATSKCQMWEAKMAEWKSPGRPKWCENSNIKPAIKTNDSLFSSYLIKAPAQMSRRMLAGSSSSLEGLLGEEAFSSFGKKKLGKLATAAKTGIKTAKDKGTKMAKDKLLVSLTKMAEGSLPPVAHPAALLLLKVLFDKTCQYSLADIPKLMRKRKELKRSVSGTAQLAFHYFLAKYTHTNPCDYECGVKTAWNIWADKNYITRVTIPGCVENSAASKINFEQALDLAAVLNRKPPPDLKLSPTLTLRYPAD